MNTTSTVAATAGVKMMFLIKRRATSTREELLVHWFANHMPDVINAMQNTAHGYAATLFDADASGAFPWDGVAQIWLDEAMAAPAEPYGTQPSDSFQQHAQPYVPWATKEYVVIDGAEQLPVTPLTLNAPYPCTRSGFFKVSFLVKTQSNIDHEVFFDHWLNVHAPNVAKTMDQVGGFHYVISHSLDPAKDAYAGMAELYFPNASGWARYKEVIQPDGMEQWVANDGTLVLRARTEMIGIP
ncbi:MAG: EthD domain-containing protein [Pseudomonadales bacterium]